MRRTHLLLIPFVLQLAPLSAWSDSQTVAVETNPVESGLTEAVTAENLMASEQYWPYHVSITTNWPSSEVPTIRAGRHGVLVRVQPDGLVRLDFGGDGRYEVPLASTNLIERANEVRLGRVHKTIPNFVLAVGSRLVDGRTGTLKPFGLTEVGERPGFLCVFADPASENFALLAEQLKPLQDRENVLTVFFPPGDRPAIEVFARLTELDWPVPFMPGPMSSAYTRSLLRDDAPLPAVILQSPEGRLIHSGAAWFRSDSSEHLQKDVTRAIDGAFAGQQRTQSAASADRENAPG